jgi:hypothetical protein
METQNIADYMNDYETFVKNFRKTEVSGEETGELIMQMAGYFARYNVRLSDALRAFSLKKAEFQNQTDPTSGKAMSTSKAEILADATPEAAVYELARVHVQNLEQYINSLKSLQKGIIIEYSNAA